MSGALNDDSAAIIRKLLVNLTVATNPDVGGSWPAYYSHLPNTPDNAICVYETGGIVEGRTHTDGQTQEQYGFQVMVRSLGGTPAEVDLGRAQLKAISDALDAVRRATVYLPLTNSPGMFSKYLVHAVTRKSSLLSLGRESPTTTRRRYSGNWITSISLLEVDNPGTGTGSGSFQ